MAKKNNTPKSLSQLRKEADQELDNFGKKKTKRSGNVQLSLRTNRMTNKQAEQDQASLSKEEAELIEHKKSLYPGHLPEKFNEQSNPPRSVGAAVPSELESYDEDEKLSESQNREELLRNFTRSMEQSSDETQDIADSRQNLDDQHIAKNRKDSEKDKDGEEL